MKRRERADRIGEILDDLSQETPVPLDHSDPYRLLVAVALSAQTNDKTVNQVTPALLAVADTRQKMATLGPERILAIISEVGSGSACTHVPFQTRSAPATSGAWRRCRRDRTEEEPVASRRKGRRTGARSSGRICR